MENRQFFWQGIEFLTQRDHVEDLGVEGRPTLELILKNWIGGSLDWIELAQDMNNWRDFVNTVMKLLVP
jgi:hypothetical protein